MLHSFLALFRFYAFFLSFFLINRLIFVGFFWEKIKWFNFSDRIKPFLYGIRIDLSIASYMLILPLLLLIIGWTRPTLKTPACYLKGYLKFVIVLVSVLTVVDCNLYQEWGSKISFRVIYTLISAPLESLAVGSNVPIISSIATIALLISIGFFLSNKIITYNLFLPPWGNKWTQRLSIALLLGTTLILLRGGLQAKTIDQSVVYFSNKPILNHAATNTIWALMDNIIQNTVARSNNPYLFLPPNEAQKLVAQLYHTQTDSAPQILKTNRPNIVLFILESHPADLFESLGGERGITPHFEKWTRQGLLFKHIYASGDRTDKGIISVLSAFPAQASCAIMINNPKQEKLPSIARNLKKEGYYTVFFYGGNVQFMNLESYLSTQQFDVILDRKDFGKSAVNTAWGIADGPVFQKKIDYLNQCKEPFFATTMTLSNHEPFDLPVPSHFPGTSVINKFKSTAYYTDSCLNTFFEAAKKYPWYKNTLFVLVADHGHRLPKSKFEIYEPPRYHIPLLLFGNVIKETYRGRKVPALGSQTDIVATVLAQMGLSHQEYKWSKNLLNPNAKKFAFYSWDNGFGFLFPNQYLAFDNVSKQTIHRPDTTNIDQSTQHTLLLYGQAYMQEVYNDYLHYTMSDPKITP